ncbi:MAG: histidine--tRNA ligase [Candidatus Omnitrophota bacterium]
MFKRIPGTKDILPEEISCWQEIEKISRKIFSIYNYREIRPPLIEEAALFNRSLGEVTEVVQKQMFLINNDTDIYALRPEATASVVRAYIENNISPLAKLYYIGPMFRLERPQKGRLRQFHHIGCEVIGSVDPFLDVEVIALSDRLLKAFSVEGYQIKINSLGCLKDKKGLSDGLRKALGVNIDGLCQECKARFERNILRILDCKKESCRQIIQKLKITDTHLCPDCKGHFSRVRSGLDNLKIPYTLSPHLVRGLDYYTRTVFEITHQGLGSQDALGAGGRYDALVSELGGDRAGSVGFAFGVERILLAADYKPEPGAHKLVYIISLGEEAKEYAVRLLDSLRKAGFAADTDYTGRSLKGALRLANDLGAGYTVIIGENELRNNKVLLKDMGSGEQRELDQESLLGELKKKAG